MKTPACIDGGAGAYLGSTARRLSICLINPRFEPSYWGFEYALPLYPGDKRSTMISGALPTLAALCGDHHVDLLDENVEDINWESLRQYDLVGVTGMNVQRTRFREILLRLRELRVFTAVGGPLVSVQEEFFTGRCDVMFVGEAETTWPQFLDAFARGQPTQRRYEQSQPTDMSQVPRPRYDLLKVNRYASGALQVLARLSLPVRVLRHHRDLWPPAPGQGTGATGGRVGRHATRRFPLGLHRGRQFHRR